MPETPEELFARAGDALRRPPVETWETLPFDGDLRPRRLTSPVADEAPRHGAGGVDCRVCAAPDTDFAWVSERWRLKALDEPTGLPVVLLLEPRVHYGEPGELPDDIAAELGLMIARIERATASFHRGSRNDGSPRSRQSPGATSRSSTSRTRTMRSSRRRRD
jgi:hypothetical protein